MTAYRFGDVVLVRFPFSDQTSAKQRPAVVVSSGAYNQDHPDVIIMAITSQPLSDNRWSVFIHNWVEAGLLKESMLKPVLATIESRLVRRTLGQLDEKDRVRLRGLLDAMLAG